jgi:hypothetical protein
MPHMKTTASGIFPVFKPVKALTVLDARPYSWEEQFTLACLQGLVNRKEPRIFLVFNDHDDRKWLDIYRKTYGIKAKEAKNVDALLAQYAGEAKGTVLFHEEMIHTMNVAQTWGSVHEALPATPRIAEALGRLGLPVLEDLRGRFKDRIDAYTWAFENLLPECNPHIVANCCTDGWYPAKDHKYLPHVKDYLFAAKAFTVDLSSTKRDRREFELFDRILAARPGDGVLLGWHCSKCREGQYVAQGARHGFFVFCNLRSPNYSIHAGIKTDYPFRQGHAAKSAVKVEDRVYVTFIHSDGDAIWAKNNFYARNWLDSQRGTFTCSWEVQPYAIDIAPGQLEYYYRTRSANDYFVHGPSGAGYTAPAINPMLDTYLAKTRTYCRKCDIKAGLIMNRDPWQAYEELVNGDLPEKVAAAFPEALGFVHGYFGVPPYLESDFVGDMPYLQTAQYVAAQHDIYAEVAKFGEHVKDRPLFVIVHVRESADFSSLKSVCERLDPAVFRIVNVDEFMLTVRKARAEGRIPNLGLDSPVLRELHAKDAAAKWTEKYQRAAWLATVVELPDELMLKEIRVHYTNFPWTLAELPDVLAWEAVETILFLSKMSLNVKGYHVNYVAKGAEQFVKVFADIIPDAAVMMDALVLWRDWLDRRVEMTAARQLARRVVTLARTLNERVLTGRL